MVFGNITLKELEECLLYLREECNFQDDSIIFGGDIESVRGK